VTDEEALRAFERASKALKESGSGSSAMPRSKRNNAEKVYGRAYQELVDRGLAPRLRKKYR
jgi:hypothetical protein